MKKRIIFAMTLVIAFALSGLLIACNSADKDTYVVMYSANGGTGEAPAATRHKEGDIFNLAPAYTFTRENYAFLCWNDGEFNYEGDEPYLMPNKNVTIKAIWEPVFEEVDTYTVSYDSGGGSGTPPPDTEREPAEEFALAPANTFNRPGFVFTGWDDGEKVYPALSNYIMPENDVTFTATWRPEEDQFTVSYDAGGGTGTIPPEAKYFEGDKVTLAPADTFVKDGYIFAGWRYGENVYDSEAVFTMPDNDVTFTPEWVEVGYDGEWSGASIDPTVILGEGIEGEGTIEIAVKTKTNSALVVINIRLVLDDAQGENDDSSGEVSGEAPPPIQYNFMLAQKLTQKADKSGYELAADSGATTLAFANNKLTLNMDFGSGEANDYVFDKFSPLSNISIDGVYEREYTENEGEENEQTVTETYDFKQKKFTTARGEDSEVQSFTFETVGKYIVITVGDEYRTATQYYNGALRFTTSEGDTFAFAKKSDTPQGETK